MIQSHKHKRITVPKLLQSLPDAPQTLYCLGSGLGQLLRRPRVAIVGSRQMSPYGQAITTKLATHLAGHGVVIISGLAYGVDACAHQAALQAGGRCIVVQANGLDTIYPAAHHYLAQQILAQQGVILSEYPGNVKPQKHTFLERNRLIAGLSQVVIITEAAARSGTLNTAAHALNQGIPVFAVPGNITSTLSAGTNSLIKAGATPLTDLADLATVLALPLAGHPPPRPANQAEATIIHLLASGVTTGDQLLKKSNLEAATYNQTLTMLELSGKVVAQGNNHWSLA